MEVNQSRIRTRVARSAPVAAGRTLLAAFVFALALALGAGVGQAQDNWAGIRSGYPFGLAVHYGIENAVGVDNDLRVTGRVYVRGGNASFGVGVDYLRTVVVESPFEVYVGAGPAVGFQGDGDFFIDLHALAGGEFRFVDFNLPELGIFIEGAIGATIGTGGSRVPDGGATVGFNYHF